MSVYKIDGSPAEPDYRGAGSAMAVVQDDQVVALNYLDDFELDTTELAPWVRILMAEMPNLSMRSTWTDLALPRVQAVVPAAIAAGYPATGPDGQPTTAADLANSALPIVRAAEKEQMDRYEEAYRAEQEAHGVVLRGTCSCYQFVTHNI